MRGVAAQHPLEIAVATNMRSAVGLRSEGDRTTNGLISLAKLPSPLGRWRDRRAFLEGAKRRDVLPHVPGRIRILKGQPVAPRLERRPIAGFEDPIPDGEL